MNKILALILIILATGATIFYSCKKENVQRQNVVTVDKPPIANAGKDTAITLPVDSVILDGSASNDPDGSIVAWKWTKISGQSSFTLVNANSENTIAKNLAEGVYQFELSVTDNGGLLSKDTVQITVIKNVPVNHPPVANAGKDTTIFLTSCTALGSAVLNGSGSTDPDSNIASYEWFDIDDAGDDHMAFSNKAITNVTGLTNGTYSFVLKVVDSGGLYSKDTVQINVINNSSPKEYNLNINLSDTFTFYDNYHFIASDYDEDDYYADYIGMGGSCSFAPMGNWNFGLQELDDTAATKYSNATLGFSQGDSSIAGDLNISFKKLIQNGGGAFTGVFKVTQGTAQRCSPGIYNNEFYPVLLNVSGTITINSRENNGSNIKCTLSMNISGKAYF